MYLLIPSKDISIVFPWQTAGYFLFFWGPVSVTLDTSLAPTLNNPVLLESIFWNLFWIFWLVLQPPFWLFHFCCDLFCGESTCLGICVHVSTPAIHLSFWASVFDVSQTWSVTWVNCWKYSPEILSQENLTCDLGRRLKSISSSDDYQI